MEQAGAEEDSCLADAPADADTEEEDSGEVPPAGDGLEDGPEEANSESTEAAAGARNETAPEVSCPPHNDPAIGRAIRRGNSPVTRQRFTRPPASRAASEHKRP